MKICLLSPLPPPAGGIATWTKIFLNDDFTKQHDVYLVNTSAIGKRVQKDTRNLLTEIKRFLCIYKNLKKTIKHTEVVHVNISCSKLGIIRDYLCVKRAKKSGQKVLVQFHCNIEDQLIASFQKKFLGKMIKLSDKLLVLNNMSKEYLKDHYGADSVLIPNFIELNKTENTHKYNEKLKTILFVGNVTEKKGVNLIVEAARVFPELNFVFVGKICKDFDNNNIPNNVELVGMVKLVEVLKYLENADLFLFPSYTEGFPLSILEAMNEGLPCVVSNVGAMPDIFENGGASIIDLNKDEIVAAINCLYDVELRRNYGEYNFKNISENYSSNVVIKKIFDEYYDLIIENK